jgi:hypothetical protein
MIRARTKRFAHWILFQDFELHGYIQFACYIFQASVNKQQRDFEIKIQFNTATILFKD